MNSSEFAKRIAVNRAVTLSRVSFARFLLMRFMAQAGHRYARTPLGINLGDLINKIE